MNKVLASEKQLNVKAKGLNPEQLRLRISKLSEKLEMTQKPFLEARIIDLRSKLAKSYSDDLDIKTPEDRFKLDLFKGQTTIPEIDAKDLSGETIAAGVLFHGALLVRGLYNKEQLSLLKTASIYEKQQKLKAPKSVISTYTFCKLMSVYDACGLLDAVRDYIGEDAIIALERARLRHKGLMARSGLTWHQDGAYFGQKCFALNCWAAITECGRENTGLSIVPQRFQKRLGWDGEGKAPLVYGNNNLERFLPANDQIISPIFNPGDAIFFDEMTLHRTAKVPEVTKEQIVSISWFFSRSRLPIYKTALGF